MVGSSILRLLKSKGFHNLVYRTSSELDLRKQSLVEEFFREEKPEYVFLAAAKVGGIYANDIYRADFLYDNLMIQTNIMHSAFLYKTEKLLFLGSSCIYPKHADQPISESSLLTGPLEPTNSSYAIAKISGIEMCKSYRSQHGCNFISVMPPNLYGDNDNYDLQNSHVLPALLRKMHDAKIDLKDSITIWGTGKPKREFLHVDDLADAALFLMERYNGTDPINAGSGDEISILDLAELIQSIVGFEGKIVHDLSKPDGTPRKILDNSVIAKLGWCAKIKLEEGISELYKTLQKAWQ